MIEKIIDATLRARFLVIAAVLLLIAVGIGAVRTTPLDAIPDLSDVQVIVFTDFPGQAPQVVEDQVTFKVPIQGRDRERLQTELREADSFVHEKTLEFLNGFSR